MKQRRTVITVLLIIAAVMLVSCSGAAQATDSANGALMYDKIVMETTAAAMSESYSYYDAEAEAPMLDSGSGIKYSAASQSTSGKVASSAGSTSSSITDTRKIIRTENLTLETKTFDQAVTDITDATGKLGGYIENSYISGRSLQSADTARYATFTLRIPAASLDEYVGYIEGSYHVTSRNTNASDITDSYYDTESRLKSLLTQEERLLEMLEGATELQYMLQIEDKLANVRYQIESYYSTLSRYDKQVAMSTVNITLNEVMEYQPVVELPKTFGQRMTQAIKNSWDNFVDNLEDFAIDFVYALPGLIMFALFVLIVVLVIVLAVKRIKKKNKVRREAEAAAIAENNEQLDALRNREQQNK